MKEINLVCLIEDDPIHVFLSKKYIEMTGVIKNVLIYNNGKDAFDNLKAMFTSGQELPELILLDLNMPIWDGWQFLEEFTKIPIDKVITIYILTSSLIKEDLENAEKYGLKGNYIVKPISLAKLKKVLLEMA